MKVLIDNVNIRSTSGPNSFGRRLMIEAQKSGHQFGPDVINPDVQLSFIMATQKRAKLALRLDGIYFNSKQLLALYFLGGLIGAGLNFFGRRKRR